VAAVKTTQPGVFHAPQLGLPRDKVRVVKPVTFTPGHAMELAKLLRELDRRDLSGVIRK
jgi:mannose/cellobiose epimerase-like protein (N-acyl-D-glucosamine 2-epimerase family)